MGPPAFEPNESGAFVCLCLSLYPFLLPVAEVKSSFTFVQESVGEILV